MPVEPVVAGKPPDYEGPDDKGDKDKEETSGPQASVSEQIDVPAMDVEPAFADNSQLFAADDENSKASEDASADAKVTLLQYYK